MIKSKTHVGKNRILNRQEVARKVALKDYT